VRLPAIALVSAFALASVTACGDPTVVEDSTTTDYFDLISFLEIPVPVTIPGGGDVIVSGRFLLSSDESCARTLSILRASAGEVVDLQNTCAWMQDGVAISLTWSDSSVSMGYVVQDTLTIVHPTGIVCVTFPFPTQWTEVYQRVAGS
jgi:hypothetical protein